MTTMLKGTRLSFKESSLHGENVDSKHSLSKIRGEGALPKVNIETIFSVGSANAQSFDMSRLIGRRLVNGTSFGSI